MEIKDQKNVELMMFSGQTVESAKEGEIVEASSEDGSQTWYTVDFTQLMILVVTPQLNKEETRFEFTYEVENTEEVDWYRKFYLENFATPEG